MYRSRWWSSLAIVLMLTLALSVLAACGSGGDDDDDDGAAGTTPAAATATRPASSAATASVPASAAGTREPATAPVAAATNTVRPVAPTATTEPAAPATATATSGPITVATEDTASGDPCEVPEVATLDPETIPNFSTDWEMDWTNFGTTGSSAFTMTLRQSAPDAYHQKFITTDETDTTTEFEIWRVGDQMYFNDGGEITQMPASEGFFSPGDMLSQVTQQQAQLYNAHEAGSERISGRDTTKYEIDGADWIDAYNQCAEEGDQLSNGSGKFTAWIDDEWKIAIKMDADMSFTNADGSDGAFRYEMLVYDIGSTATVEPPQ